MSQIVALKRKIIVIGRNQTLAHICEPWALTVSVVMLRVLACGFDSNAAGLYKLLYKE